MKDPVWSKIVHIEVHTQLHSATRVFARANFERPLRAHTKLNRRTFFHSGILYVV